MKFVEYTMEVDLLMHPILVAVMASTMVLQKNRALPSMKGHREGMKLKLMVFAIVMAVASKLRVASTQSQMTALF